MRNACIALGLALCIPGLVFAQAADTPYQVRYVVNLNRADSTLRVVNTGASMTVANDPINGTLCANFYAFGTNGQMTSCCTCPVAPNGLLSLSVTNNLVPLGTQLPSALVIKMLASYNNPCGGPSVVGTGPDVLATGLAAWATTAQALPANSYELIEGAFTPSTLSAAELTKLDSQCASLPTHGFCRSCPQPN